MLVLTAARRALTAACEYTSNRSTTFDLGSSSDRLLVLFSELNYGQQNEDVDMIREL